MESQEPNIEEGVEPQQDDEQKSGRFGDTAENGGNGDDHGDAGGGGEEGGGGESAA